MIWRYVCYYCDVGMEIVAVVQLEAAYFQHIIVKVFGRYLVRIALADVAAQADVKPGILQQVIY